MNRSRWTSLVWAITIGWVSVLLCSLKTGWLNRFFFDTDQLPFPGIDFFSVERGWVNLLAGRSEFDTFHANYGPYATWLNYHPLLAVMIGPILMPFAPFAAYAVWTGISVLLMAAAAWVLSSGATSLQRACTVLLLLGAFPTFILLQSGNVQAVLVLSSALIFTALHRMAEPTQGKGNQGMLLAGLLVSLFSKPIALASLPLLVLLRETRRTALGALGIYLGVSLLSLVVPAWNPEPISWGERWMWITHPHSIAAAMNVYTNHFTITKPMRDNAVHWFAMIGVTDFRFNHIDIYSLSALLDGWLHTHTPDVFYRIPLLLVIELSVLVAFVRNHGARMQAALMVAMASSLLLILSYGVVWEYHYTLVLPVAAILLGQQRKDWIVWCALVMGVLVWLPSLYAVLRTHNLETAGTQTLLRAERVLPVLILFLLLLSEAVCIALQKESLLRFSGQNPEIMDVRP